MRIAAATVLLALAIAAQAYAAPASPEFVKTKDSDDWVKRTFQINQTNDRVFLVGDVIEYPKAVFVRPIDLASRKGTRLEFYPVTVTYRTLQEAADAAKGGDTIIVMPGAYAGFELGDVPTARDGKYIRFTAMREAGEVTIDRPAPGKDSNWMIYLKGAHHVIIQGFNIAGATGPDLEPKGARAGIMIDGDFGNTGKMAHNIVITQNFSHNHRSWGLHATDSHSVLIQDCCFAFSCEEHSAYVSDGSDNYCIRRNVFFGSSSSGLQCNLDPEASLGELLKHPLMKDYPKEGDNREWAQGLLKLAEETFGEHNCPDGRGVNFIIEQNVVYGNGRRGGGSLNLAGLQDSLIQNNLIYGNLTTGIAEWDNGNPYDAAANDPGPASQDEVKEPGTLAIWGCHGNLIRNNTVIMDNPGRVAMLLNNGSWGNKLRNNVFINDSSHSIEVTNTSAYLFDSGYNVLNTLDVPVELIRATVNLDQNNHSSMEVKRRKIADEFVNYGEEPWMVVQGAWWRLNAERPDFHPRKDSTLLRSRGDVEELPDLDLEGDQRFSADVGAFRASLED